MTQRAPGALSIDVPLSLSEDLITGLGSISNRDLFHKILVRIVYRNANELAQAAPRAPPIILMRFEATRICSNRGDFIQTCTRIVPRSCRSIFYRI